MNCKPGDIARVVADCANRDALLQVLDSVDCEPGYWRCKALQSMTGYLGHHMAGVYPPGTIGWEKDINLRPIRDPGDDAKDETLEWLPVPSREEVSA